jgi:hypothetical protein
MPIKIAYELTFCTLKPARPRSCQNPLSDNTLKRLEKWAVQHRASIQAGTSKAHPQQATQRMREHRSDWCEGKGTSSRRDPIGSK